MIRSRFGLRAIGLCLAVAGLMAVSAGVAQAEVGSYWLVNGVKVTTLLPELTGSLENNHGTLLGEIGGVGIHILCTGFTTVGVHLLAEGGVLGKVKFTGCIVRQLKTLGVASSLTTLGACAPAGGVIETVASKGLIVLHLLLVKHIIEGKEVVLDLGLDTITRLEPNAGPAALFASFPTSEECAFGEKIEIYGKLAVKDCNNAFLTDLPEHLIEEFPALTELWLNNQKANKATIDGSAIIKLAGAHEKLTWAGHPA